MCVRLLDGLCIELFVFIHGWVRIYNIYVYIYIFESFKQKKKSYRIKYEF